MDESKKQSLAAMCEIERPSHETHVTKESIGGTKADLHYSQSPGAGKFPVVQAPDRSTRFTMGKCIAAMVLVTMVSAGYYFYDRSSYQKYRRDSLERLSRIAETHKDIDLRHGQLLARLEHQVTISESDKADLLLLSSEIGAVRRKFTDLEEMIKANNNGELPRWLKDDRAWQQLHTSFGRRP